MMQFFKKVRIKKSVYMSVLIILLFSLISFVEKQHCGKVFKDIKIDINNEFENYFVDDEEVIRLMTANNSENLIGRRYEDIKLNILEQRIKSHKFVESAQVYKDHKGNLLVEVKQCRPIARIIQMDGPDAYIGNKGYTLNTSEKYTARVVIVYGDYVTSLIQPGYLNSETGQAYFKFFQLIDSDSFLKAQISQVSIDEYGEITIHPQVGKELIILGHPEDLESKFKKLKIYYKTILPQKGWDTYEIVNLKYKDQIICD